MAPRHFEVVVCSEAVGTACIQYIGWEPACKDQPVASDLDADGSPWCSAALPTPDTEGVRAHSGVSLKQVLFRKLFWPEPSHALSNTRGTAILNS